MPFDVCAGVLGRLMTVSRAAAMAALLAAGLACLAGPAAADDCATIRKRIELLQESVAQLSKLLGSTEANIDDINRLIQKTVKESGSSGDEAVRGQLLDHAANLAKSRAGLRKVADDIESELRSLKNDITALLNRLGVCGQKKKTVKPPPRRKPVPQAFPPDHSDTSHQP